MEEMCPICNSRSVECFLRREQVPVHQHLVSQSPNDARNISRGNLALMHCVECDFIYNGAFDLAKLSYGELYDNTQTCSSYFSEYIDELIKSLIVEKNVQNCNIVEVGCGQGLFLTRLVERGLNSRGYGFDPSYQGPDITSEGRIEFYKTYYGEGHKEVPTDVVVCRHVIEHVPDPVALLLSIKQALKNSTHARVFLETPCVEWILTNQVGWDFFYEHCSYFTAESLTRAFQLAGFKVDNVRYVFNGQYLWVEASISDEKGQDQQREKIQSNKLISRLIQQFSFNENALINKWKEKVVEFSLRGKVAIWGAGAKGSTFANLVDPDGQLIDCIVDLNPGKQENFLPGTGHQIVKYEELPQRGVLVAILMNPNYRKENEDLLRKAGIDLTLIEMD